MGPATDLTLEGLVHDLNNVFETISEAAELLESDPKWSAIAAAIHRSLERGRRIVGSFSSDTPCSPEFDIVLNNAIEFTRDFLAAIHAPCIQFVCLVEPGIRLKGSPAAWERVFFNLFVNAAQAMESGGEVEISAFRSQGEIEIMVADSGPGISVEILPKIFRPHFSTKSSRSGLGLNIVESIVTQQGGTVSASNRAASRGAAFTIRVPLS